MSTNSDRLVSDLKMVVSDAEAMLRETADDVSERAKAAREKLSAAVMEAKNTCTELEAKALEGARMADRKVREYPYHAMGVAFGVGIVMGLLLRRK